MKRNRQTKIVATLGPASNDMIPQLFESGVDVFRVNFSHADEKGATDLINKIRAAEKKYGRPVTALADLQGPKIRMGNIPETLVKKGDILKLGEKGLDLPHPEIFKVLKKDDAILIDDGRLRLTVLKNDGKTMEARAENMHVLLPRKGINLPGRILPLPALTAKDKKDLKIALKLDFDWIALSFVQTADDVREAQNLIKGKAKLMVKLEKPSALEQLEEIIELSDGVMLARGDLGVEIPIEQVPSTQKRVVHAVRATAKPIIVATQMLESMISSPFPTRAEASDVATAIYDGADAVMLSGETASGLYPIEAVSMMDRIAQTTENDPSYLDNIMETYWDTEGDIESDVISRAAAHAAEELDAKFIVSYTTSGGTSRLTARQRPSMPILSLTPNEKIARQLSLSYGIHAVVTKPPKRLSELEQYASKIAIKEGLGAYKGEPCYFVMTAGTPFGIKGTTNTMRVATLKK